MTERKWTKGPWLMKRGKLRKNGSIRIKFSGGTWTNFATAWVRLADCRFDVDEGLANAHLIAAAPDLYEALEMARVWLEFDGRFDMQGINAALAKARGEK